jgi:predicted XRE-type DNA-binding protein
MANTKPRVTRSSGNVFADLGIKDPDEALLKAQLASRIAQAISAKKLTQAEAGRQLGIDQPKVSALLRGRLKGFSTDRLLKYVRLLGSDVEVILRDAREEIGHVHIRMAAG